MRQVGSGLGTGPGRNQPHGLGKLWEPLSTCESRTEARPAAVQPQSRDLPTLLSWAWSQDPPLSKHRAETHRCSMAQVAHVPWTQSLYLNHLLIQSSAPSHYPHPKHQNRQQTTRTAPVLKGSPVLSCSRCHASLCTETPVKTLAWASASRSLPPHWSWCSPPVQRGAPLVPRAL